MFLLPHSPTPCSGDHFLTDVDAAVSCIDFHVLSAPPPPGDHALTGLAIGKMLGIAGNNTVITGPEIDSMSDDRLAQLVNG